MEAFLPGRQDAKSRQANNRLKHGPEEQSSFCINKEFLEEIFYPREDRVIQIKEVN